MVLCSLKTVENCLVKILENSVSRISTNREFPLINRMFLFDWSNRNRESIESTRLFMMNLLKFRPIENSLRSIECSFSIDRIGIDNRSSHPDCLLKSSSWFRSMEGYIQSIESYKFWIFTKCFHIEKCKAMCDEITHVFSLKNLSFKISCGERYKGWIKHLVLAMSFAFHVEGINHGTTR